jgi:hypothetical protein
MITLRGIIAPTGVAALLLLVGCGAPVDAQDRNYTTTEQLAAAIGCAKTEKDEQPELFADAHTKCFVTGHNAENGNSVGLLTFSSTRRVTGGFES